MTMLKTPKQTIATALTDWVEKPEKKGEPVANQVKLCHVPDGAPPRKVQSWVITTPGTNLSELTGTIFDTATDHAHSGKGATVEEYLLFPYFGAELEEGASRRFCIRIVHDSSHGEAGGYSEPATPTGQVHQGMRHIEKRVDQIDQRESTLWTNMQTELKRLTARCEKLEKDLSVANQGIEEAKDQSLERKLKIFKANQEETRKDKVIDAFIPVGMMLGNSVMGAPVFQVNSDDQSQQAIVHFLSSLKKKQIEQMYGAFDPQQRLFFDHVLEQINAMKKAAWEEKQKAAQEKVNGAEQDPKTMETLAKRQPQEQEGPST